MELLAGEETQGPSLAAYIKEDSSLHASDWKSLAPEGRFWSWQSSPPFEGPNTGTVNFKIYPALSEHDGTATDTWSLKVTISVDGVTPPLVSGTSQFKMDNTTVEPTTTVDIILHDKDVAPANFTIAGNITHSHRTLNETPTSRSYGAYKSVQITYKVSDSSGTLIWQETEMLNPTTNSTAFSKNWTGTQNQGTLPPDAPPGLYTWDVSADVFAETSPTISATDLHQFRSTKMDISQTRADSLTENPDLTGTGQTGYVLQLRSGVTAADASSAKVELYDVDRILISTDTNAGKATTPFGGTPTWNSAINSIPYDTSSPLSFFIIAKDNHAASDKMHITRTALPKAQNVALTISKPSDTWRPKAFLTRTTDFVPENATVIPVWSTGNLPSSGKIGIFGDVLTYLSKTPTQFNLSSGAPANYPDGAAVYGYDVGGDNETTSLTGTLSPDNLVGRMHFALENVSKEPGITVNHGIQTATEPDLVFLPNRNTNFDITTDRQKADWKSSVAPVNPAAVDVTALDFGAYGKVTARFAGILGRIAADPDSFTKDERFWYSWIPFDEDQDAQGNLNRNFIWDKWGPNSDGTWNTGTATDDNENNPVGDGTLGDGFSRYEEYRGFVIRYIRTGTDPTKKDLFIRDRDHLGFGYFGDLGLTTYDIGVDWNNEVFRVMNYNWGTAHNQEQKAVRLLEAPPQGNLYGCTYCSGLDCWGSVGEPACTPNTSTKIHIHTETIWNDAGTYFPDPVERQQKFNAMMKAVIAHELGHDVNIPHHGAGTDQNCIMKQFADWNNISNTYTAANPNCRALWRLH